MSGGGGWGGRGQNLGDGWSKSIVLENKGVLNFDFRNGAKKLGHLDPPQWGGAGTPEKMFLSENVIYFVAILKFVAIYGLFWKSLGKKGAFGVKNSVVWAKKCTNMWYVLRIQQSQIWIFAIMAKTTHLSRK